jgi:hypothetical protein
MADLPFMGLMVRVGNPSALAAERISKACQAVAARRAPRLGNRGRPTDG